MLGHTHYFLAYASVYAVISSTMLVHTHKVADSAYCKRGKFRHMVPFRSILKIVLSILCEFFVRNVCMNYGTYDGKA